jgi:crotonobetainyl-CoA:carnitine CoA-transferase CaiB-like acyl-CoA transferase
MRPVLSGLRGIAVEQYGASPYGSIQLADLGAEIIKVENPADGGDMARRVGPYFVAPSPPDAAQQAAEPIASSCASVSAVQNGLKTSGSAAS